MAFDPIPVPVRGSPTFNADAEAFALGMSQFAQDYNALSSVLDAALTSSSTTSLAISTGSKTLTVQAGLGYVVGYPIRIASTANPTNNMDGIVTAYNNATGSLTVDVLSVSGSGTLASWNTMVLPGGGNFATLSFNKFSGRQVFANEVTLASASTLDFTTGNSNQFFITGTTTITAVTIEQGAIVKARFGSACQLTHGANLQIPGAANYTTSAGDIVTFTSNGTVVRAEISKADGTAVTAPTVINGTNDPTFASTSTTNPASPEWVRGYAQANNNRLLGTLTTTSGTVQTLSSLTLTGYKSVRLVFDNVANNAGDFFNIDGPVAITQATGSAGRSIWGVVDVDLFAGVFTSNINAGLTTTGVVSGQVFSTQPAGKCSVTTSSTSISVSCNSGNFTSGSIRIYGVV